MRLAFALVVLLFSPLAWPDTVLPTVMVGEAYTAPNTAPPPYSYAAGGRQYIGLYADEGGVTFRQLFVFDPATLTSDPVTAATLNIPIPQGNNSFFQPSGAVTDVGYYSADASETLGLFDVTTSRGNLSAGTSGDSGSLAHSIYDDLGSGTMYGSAIVSEASEGTVLQISLGAEFLAAINAARAGGSQIGIGASLTSIVGERSPAQLLVTNNLPVTLDVTQGTVIPLPASAWAGGALLLAMGALRIRHWAFTTTR